MKIKSLTTAVLAGLTGVAGIVSVSNAVHINPDNTGQVLLYPYYTARDGNVTIVSIVNTTEDAKAVKVRFIEGENSQEVLDFNLYMSGFDIWLGTIADDGADGGQFTTTDNSCTVPYFFSPAAGTGSLPFSTILFTDGGNTGRDRTREGYVEMIEMGVLTNASEGSAAAATHGGPPDSNGNTQPQNCAQLVQAWSTFGGAGGYWQVDAQTDMAPPSGGLFGDGVILNVPGARAAGYSATALDAFYVPGDGDPVSLHRLPETPSPSLVNVFPAVSNTYLSTGNATPLVVSDDWAVGGVANVQAVTAVLMVDQVMNQYDVGTGFNGSTEWVITHPTKRFHAGGVPPFTVSFSPSGTACEPISVRFFDRNEDTTGTTPGPSPAIPGGGSALCYEVNVVTFDTSAEVVARDTTPVLGSKLDINFDVQNEGFTSGWLQMAFNSTAINHLMTNDDSGNTYFGLPVVGFSERTADNGALQFGAAFDHAYSRVIQ